MISKVGLDGVTFLRFLRMLRNIFTIMTVGCAVLIGINVAYNLKYIESDKRNALSLLTIQSVGGNWVWPALGMSYLFCKSTPINAANVRLSRHVLCLAQLADHGLAAFPLVSLGCLSRQDLRSYTHGDRDSQRLSQRRRSAEPHGSAQSGWHQNR
jgi:hypothetical protein